MSDQPQLHSDGRPAAFRRFELTISLHLPVDEPLPGTFREWLTLATGIDCSNGPASSTRLERVVETRHPPAQDVAARRFQGSTIY